jgi:hypothetical protein
VGTPEAVGAIGDYLPVSSVADDAAFRAAAIDLLSAPSGPAKRASAS